ncbi:hypothetical protein [Reinekea marinisedimentorum]|uniref:Aspartyl protease n=1 Tax=Reinekea marinisedimentorum TaxID=230495 RepID=A0A4R3HV13_9GAMM|nr:hypothetical protein [Reinekea marinisedimentorum]TCS35885.1 hypothetical protein BCF53_1291 [Reinekea marinisedimentorum]
MRFFLLGPVLLFILSTVGCSTVRLSDLQSHGSVKPDKFYAKGDISFIGSRILISANIHGEEKNYIFDTGAEASFIHKNKSSGKSVNVSSPLGETLEYGSEYIDSIKIMDIEFVDTFAVNGNRPVLSKEIDNFGGLIGAPVINKANWLISFTENYIEFSDRSLIKYNYAELNTTVKNGLKYIEIDIGGIKQYAQIDLGSSAAILLPHNSKIAKALLQTNEYVVKRGTATTATGKHKISAKVIPNQTVYLGKEEISHLDIIVTDVDEAIIGSDFFKGTSLYFDNSNDIVYLKK